MKFFFDNNLPSDLAHGLREMSRAEPRVDRVVHMTDLFNGSEKDLVWIPGLVEADRRPWYVVSLDKFRKNQRAEREAIARAGHTVYVLDPQWGKHNFWMKAERLVMWWPHLLKHAAFSQGGVYCVPWKHSSQSRFRAM